MLILGSYPSLMMSRPEYHGSWVGKTFRSFWNAFASAAKFPPFSLRLNDGEKVHLHRTRLALLANNDYEDIFGVIPQRQSLDAGFFTVYVSKHRSLFGMAKSAGSWILGRWKQDREISKMRATELEIDVKKTRELAVMIDGELEKVPSPFRVKLLPKALKVIAPRLAVEAGKAEQDAAAV
jgi:diacylglycerol kinase family enzyme